MRPLKWERSTGIYLLVFSFFLLVPFFYDNRTILFLMTQIFIFGIFAMSYDLLLGFTGIVSFGHAMFFGIGAYSVSVIIDRNEPTMGYLLLGTIVGIVIAGVVSLLAGLLTLRLKSHFYAMLTLALAGLFLVLAEKWRGVTGGNDGFTMQIPEFFKDRGHLYLTCLVSLIVLFFLVRRFTQSPTGRVVMAIRENEQRVESIGFSIMFYKVAVSVISGIVASIAGVLYILSLRFVDTSVFATDVTLDALLMTIIGGVGTLVGPLIGAGLIEVAHHYLSELASVHWIFERWLILFGIVYILAVIFFPRGIVGSLQYMWAKRSAKKKSSSKEKDLAS
ncbi:MULTISPECIES: branched-chain amino acid ABC transporter permease [Pontibacillus]|uniref:Branched-chain amino acid ABC transporter permease n=1 Tax=Pontibacillus chungwhensis TaxID=265426 RepID=A0ABY8V0P6_9BACI|nr:branched-chain amino acid ABC transporter permease [Pontibacillus chungwhensis]MCD5325823.1 branched-chain amino acid ABC transporter permease [Pontibacillus sp. HN14]WIF98354.1 branched-chain amino acid ABC transporter permease [Pontibacillus chungwhensis]